MTLVIALAVIFLVGLLLTSARWRSNDFEAKTPHDTARISQPASFPITIKAPSSSFKVTTGQLDLQGNPIEVACSTCHSNRKPDFENRITGDLREFHTNGNVTHGSISCLSCHNPDDYDSFRLADGTPVAHQEVMKLCAQCHGTQMRDYERGVHGGMTGYWDRTRGPQFKLNCLDCHLAHEPKFPPMQPTFKPRDRFLPGSPHRPADPSSAGDH
jgi:formate-dependent nitrite reductase cytochrome c552 subunit